MIMKGPVIFPASLRHQMVKGLRLRIKTSIRSGCHPIRLRHRRPIACHGGIGVAFGLTLGARW